LSPRRAKPKFLLGNNLGDVRPHRALHLRRPILAVFWRAPARFRRHARAIVLLMAAGLATPDLPVRFGCTKPEFASGWAV